MKKIIKSVVSGLIVLAAMNTIFAEIRFNGFATSALIIGNKDSDTSKAESGDKVYHKIGQVWDSGGTMAGVGQLELNMHGISEVYGADMSIHIEGGELVPAEAAVWVKPIAAFDRRYKDILQVHVGKGAGDRHVMRTDVCFGMWEYNRCMGTIWCGNFSNSEGWTFQSGEVDGIVFDINPIKGLNIEVSVPMSLKEETEVETDWKYGAKYLAKYNILDYATVRLGYLSRQPNYYKDTDNNVHEVEWGVINAAVDVTGVPNFFATIGAFVPTFQGKNVLHETKKKLDDDWNGTNFFDMSAAGINAYAKYRFDPFTFHLIGSVAINAIDQQKGTTDHKWNDHEAFGYLIGGGIDYMLPYEFNLQLDVRYANDIFVSRKNSDDPWGKDCLSAGIGVEKRMHPGVLRVGFQCATNNINVPFKVDVDKNGKDNLAWCIPVVMQFGF